jgi:endonuclease YncB( thermonuclease family)
MVTRFVRPTNERRALLASESSKMLIQTTKKLPLRAGYLLLLALPMAAGAAIAENGGDPARLPGQEQVATRRPEIELFEVVKIVDGDTLHVLRHGTKEKLRLLSVDTEEKITPGMSSSPSKPQTVFGEETRLWTIAFLEQLRGVDGKIRVGLRFPGAAEERDVYGRLLCHVILPDGADFNLLLVRLGKSPYFNKYGNSLIAHEEFAAAQVAARHNLVGIWDPSTNRPLNDDTPSAKRPYERLLPWWQVRAEAIDDFRKRSAADPARVIHAEDAEALLSILVKGAGEEIEVFGTPDRFFDEDDGSLTVLFRATDRKRAFRARIPASSRKAFESLELKALTEEYRQNHVYVRGKLVRGERGPEIITAQPTSWRRAVSG